MLRCALARLICRMLHQLSTRLSIRQFQHKIIYNREFLILQTCRHCLPQCRQLAVNCQTCSCHQYQRLQVWDCRRCRQLCRLWINHRCNQMSRFWAICCRHFLKLHNQLSLIKRLSLLIQDSFRFQHLNHSYHDVYYC